MDEKLCPMRKRAYKLGSGPGMPRSTSDEFLPCIREKCAWWKTDIDFDSAKGKISKGADGHCAVLEK